MNQKRIVFGEIKLKSLKISVIVTLFAVAFLCVGSVAALTQDEATARAIFINGNVLPAGQQAAVSIFFGSLSNDSLVVTYISLHFDWMPTGQVVGINYTAAPVTIESMGSKLFDQMQITIPSDITSGIHSYYIAIDGTDNGSPFSWNSPDVSLEVTGGSGISTTPTPTSGGAQPEGQTNLLLYSAAGAVVIIVVLLIMVLLVRKKRKQFKTPTKQEKIQPEKPIPEKKPDSGQDFTI